MCQWLNISFAQEMLQFSASAKKLVASDEMAWKKEVLGPLITNNMNKWEKALSPEKIGRIEAACSPTFQDGLYEKAFLQSTLKNNLYSNVLALLSAIYKSNIKFKNWQINQAIT